jgi:DNA-binding CsgD family transcriptional regulator
MDDVAAVRSDAPFVARTAELDRLRLLTQEAAGGAAAAVLIAGDAGIGKTSLIAEVARRAAGDGLLVLFGRCVDLGTGALPYLPFAEALSQLVRTGEAGSPADQEDPGPAADDPPITARAAARIVRQVARERPVLGRIAGAAGQGSLERAPGDTGLDRLALFEAVSHVLGRIGDEIAPLLLVLEDLHWADASTRDLVRFLLARLGNDRLLVIASYRADDLHRRHPLRPLLGELLRLPQVERMELQPFASAELADLLTAVNGDRPDPELLDRIAARSAGNAYYAEELFAAGDDAGLPTGLADVLLDRLERLGPPAQQVVRVASVLGSARIEDALLRACVEADPRAGLDVETALHEVVAHQLLVPDGPDRYAFRHALLQEAVYADLLPGERVRLHATAAQQLVALAEADARSERLSARTAAELARHAMAAHDLPLALSASLRAALEASRRSAPAEALAHYEQALQLWCVVESDRRPDGWDPVGIGVAAAAVAGDAGLHERAVALARGALDDAADRMSAATARAALALHSYAAGDGDEAREQGRRVVADLEGVHSSAARVLARSIEIRVDVSMGEAEAALDVLPAAVAEAEELGLLGMQAELLISSATAHGMIGDDTAERWATARAAAERAGDQAAMVRVLYSTAIDRIDSGDLPGAVEVITRALAVAEAAGLSSSLYGAQSRSLLISIRWHLGDAEGALAVVRSDRQLTAGLARRLRLFALPVQAVRDPEQVLDARSWLLEPNSLWHNQVLYAARAEAFGWVGRAVEAAAAARKALAYMDSEAPHQLAGIAIATTGLAALADAAARARERSDDAGVQRAIDEAVPFIDDARERGRLGRPRRFTMGPEGLAWLDRVEAEAARLLGTDDEALWGRVAKGFEGISVHEAARARWRRAQVLARTGQRDRAREEATAARRAAVGLGARPMIEALDDLARRARFEVTAPEPAGAVLTRRERDVMALVAQGLTNRAIGEKLFISEKTASVHVSNVMAKLGASGRTEAVAIVARHGLLG